MSTNCTILGVSCSPVKVILAPWTLRLLGQVEGQKTPVLRSAKRAAANVRLLYNSSDVIFYCSVGERSRALALLNAALDKPISTEPFTCKTYIRMF